MLNVDRLYRSAVLGVAGNGFIKKLVHERARFAVNRFVAGETLQDALQSVDALEQDGIHGILDLLGEMVNTEAEAEAFTAQILEICTALEAKAWPKYISIKLSQLGLDLRPELALENARHIAAAARLAGAFVRVDMEDSPRIDKTIEVFRALRAEFFNVGLVLQSMLYRSEKDLENLSDLQPNLRIVKGAYLEPTDVAYPDKNAVDMAYRRLVYRNLELGHHTAIATHDESIIKDIKVFVEKSEIPLDLFEFQMLYGIRRDLQKQLAQEGFTVRAYIPYGKDWYAYFSRRIAERPANVGFVLRGMLKG
jgi:proline dehydrogenase